MRVGLRLYGKAIGIDPADPFYVYANRDDIGAWEVGELTQTGNIFSFKFLQTKRQLAITPYFKLESRPEGAIGVWEQFFCTTQPDGISLLYRVDDHGELIAPVLTIEEA